MSHVHTKRRDYPGAECQFSETRGWERGEGREGKGEEGNATRQLSLKRAEPRVRY